MLGRSEIAIIIPSYNEDDTILDVVREVSIYGYPIVIDDQSSDSTASILKKNKIDSIRNEKNLGYDGSLNVGFNFAKNLNFKYAITFDADGQHDISALPEFIKALNEGYDIVIGIRPYYQRFGEKTFSILSLMLFGIKDPLCGMKGYNLKVYKELGHFDSYQSIGTELLFFNLKNKKKFFQIPIKQYKRIDKSRLGSNLKMNIRIFRSIIITFFKWF